MFLQKIDQKGVITAKAPEETDPGTGPDAQGRLTGTGNIMIVGGVGVVTETDGLGIDTTGDTNYSMHINRLLRIPFTLRPRSATCSGRYIFGCVSASFRTSGNIELVRVFVPLSAC